MEEESYEDIIDAYNSGVAVEPGESLTDYIKRNNIKIKPIQTEDITGSSSMEKDGVMQLASGNMDILIEEVVREFIKQRNRRPRSLEEIKEFYMEEMAPRAGAKSNRDNVMLADAKMASGKYSPDEVEMYEQYKYDMNEQRPGMPIMEIDDFLRMELGSARAGVAAGGLPSILGV
jgi:hypothetical protein|tara:strand:- start:1179 stop:1703 length:525 start_codon:yes stop_codon:yes gene_type:complete